MLNKIRNRQGFTLIELLIVVAIIGILAAVAIPQFAAYRIKGFNSAASADTRNLKTAEEGLFADNQTYGVSIVVPAGGALIPTPVPVASGPAAGFTVGPQVAATATILGAYITGPDNAGRGVAIGYSLSNNVHAQANSVNPVAPAVTSGGYLAVAKHLQGDTAYATESLGTSYFACTNDAFVRVAGAGGATVPALPAAYTNPVLANTVACGGAPVLNWTQK